MQPPPSHFDPLPRIICFDDFDRGFCGFTQLVGNYEGSLDTMLPAYAENTAPMLSSLPMFDGGSHGGLGGTYSMRIQTRPRAGARATAVKRLTFRRAGEIRLEFWFTFKPESGAMALGETDVRAVGFLYDLQSGDRDGNPARIMPHLRFLNARDGEHIQRWQFKRQAAPAHEIGAKTGSHDHMGEQGWEDLPGGEQRLCYNEIATKVNWHYARFDMNLADWQASRLQVNDRVFDMAAFRPMRMPAWKNLWCMLNLSFFVISDVDRRAFLAIDSVCLSGEF